MKAVAVPMLAAALLAGAPAPCGSGSADAAPACLCVRGGAERARAAADAHSVFLGMAVAESAFDQEGRLVRQFHDPSTVRVRYAFIVARVWKGPAPVADVLLVESPAPTSSCARPYALGETYLVYAGGRRDSRVLSTLSCSRVVTGDAIAADTLALAELLPAGRR